MGYAAVEGSAQDRALCVEGTVVTEVLPKAERDGGQEQAAAPTTAIGHRPVAIFGGVVSGHVSPALSWRCRRIYSSGCTGAIRSIFAVRRPRRAKVAPRSAAGVAACRTASASGLTRSPGFRSSRDSLRSLRG